MTGRSQSLQRGYALLLLVLLLMGAGGVVLAGFTQQARQDAEEKRFTQNKRVLQQAKQALLMYAYNYPEFNNEGPGRLPCPDTDNDVDGLPGDGGALTIAICTSVGRLPWGDPDLGFFDARDANGERLWYAVSSSFHNLGGGPVINSDSTGSITLVDQSGSLLYDGAVAGIAAVIIAPGAIIRRDEDNNGVYEFTQLRNTVAQQVDPRNYLDTFNGFDNSTFVNGSNAVADSFILGPVFDINEGDVVVNDQMIIVTAEEVIAMAEKKTLEVYRDAINDYLANTGNQYPWLYNYVDVPSVAGLQEFFPGLDSFTDPTVGVGERVTYLGNRGRVPSMFSDYFVAADTRPIESKLDVEFTLTYPTLVAVDRTGGAGTPFLFNAGAAHDIDIRTANVLTNVRFLFRGPGADDASLRFTAGTTETFTHTLYFWDFDEVAPSGVFTLCPDDGDGVSELEDCHRQSDGTPNPGGPNDNHEEILRVVLEFEIDGTDDFEADFVNLSAPVYTAASANGHARIERTIPAIDVIFSSIPVSATYEYDDHYHEDPTSFNVQESGTLDVNDLIMGSLTLGLRYYPVLPRWAYDNDWHESLLMAYAADYRPDAGGGPCTATVDCLDIQNLSGPNDDNKVSLLVVAGQHDWNDEGGDGFDNDLLDVFDAENDDLNDTFDVRAANGDDTILVIEEL